MTTVVISPTGIQGPAGNTIIPGEGAPGNTVGVDGDYYVDLTNYPTSCVFYGPKVGTWPAEGVTLGGGGGGGGGVISVNSQTGVVTITAAGLGALLAASNLSDLASATTARTNLGLGEAAVLGVGTSSGTVAAGNDTRIVGAAQTANNLGDLASEATARSNLGLGTAAVANIGTSAGTVASGTDTRITGALQAGNNLSDVASAPTARTNLGLGTAATAGAATGAAEGILQLSGDLSGTATSPAVVSTHLAAALPTAQGGTGAASLTAAGILQAANNLSDIGNEAAARTNLGLGTAATAGAATSGSEGILQLAGDLSGTASSPTVVSTHLASALPAVQGGTGATSLSGAGLLQASNNLSDVGNASTARSNLGLGSFVATLNGATGTTTAAYPLAVVAKQTSAYAAAANQLVPVDTTSGAVTVTLPAAPADRTVVAVKMVVQGGSNAVTVACAGSDVFNKTGGGIALALPLLNQGIALQYAATGAIWYVTGDDLPLSQTDLRYAQLANNLSDLPSQSTARTNLGLGGAATLNVGTTTGTVAAGNDTRITGALQSANNLSDLGSATTARTNLGLGAAATAGAATSGAEGIIQLAGDIGGSASVPTVVSTHLASALPTAQGGTGAASLSAAGILQASNNLSDVTTAATARANLGLGTGAVAGAATTLAQGIVQLTGDLGGTGASPSVLKVNGIVVNGTPAANQVIQASNTTTAAWASLTPGGIGALAKSSNLSDVSSAATARTNLGLTSVATASVGLSTDMVAAGTPAAGATGRWTDAGHAHPSPGWVPSDNNLIWSTVNPLQAGTTCTLASSNAGVLTLQRVLLRDAVTLTNIMFGVSGVDGASPSFSNCYLGLYDALTGTRQAVTADISSVINVALVHTVAWTSTYAAPAGEYFIALVMNGTWTSGTASTTWNLKATGGGSTSNTGLAAPHLYLSNMLTAQTTLPGTLTLTSQATGLISAGWGSQWYGFS